MNLNFSKHYYFSQEIVNYYTSSI